MNNLQERKVFVPVDVNDGNKLIAEFMNEQGASHKNAYAENWNALMPVVEKIVYEIVGKRHVLKSEEDILFFEQIGIQWRKIQLSLITPVILSEQKPIDAVYRAVIEFIQWYKGLSENKNQNEV